MERDKVERNVDGGIPRVEKDSLATGELVLLQEKIVLPQES